MPRPTFPAFDPVIHNSRNEYLYIVPARENPGVYMEIVDDYGASTIRLDVQGVSAVIEALVSDVQGVSAVMEALVSRLEQSNV